MALITNLYSALAQGTLWGIMALGVYITFRILDIADLSCDGTFALGGCISAILITRGVNPFVTLLFALVGGMLAGLVTGWLHTKLMIPAILAGNGSVRSRSDTGNIGSWSHYWNHCDRSSVLVFWNRDRMCT